MSECDAGNANGDDPGDAGAPFRDLFIELPRTLFEVLQGIGEAAVKAATTGHRPRSEPQLLSFLRNHGARKLLAKRFGWLGLDEPRYAAMESAIELRVIRACGHQTWVSISERTLESFDALDEIDRMLWRHHERGRRCSCILQQKATTR